jgi:hypothetical protein
MTQRSIQAGSVPTVIVRASMDVQVEGWDDERVLANTEHKRGLKIERRSESAVGHLRARAKVGDRVLFDVETDLLKRKKKDAPDDAIQVSVGGDATVRVPYSSTVKVYGGRGVEVRDIRGSVTVYAGRDVRVRNVHMLVHATAGRGMDLECESLAGNDVEFSAGRDLRFYVRDLNDVRLMVDDLGGYWEGVIGNGRTRVRLKAGGDVTVVTDRDVVAQPPDYVVGKLERPSDASGQDAQTSGE